MKKWARIIAVILAVILIVAAVFVLDKAHEQAMWFVYPGDDRSRAEETPADYGLDYQDITLTTQDGVQLAAWYVPTQNGAVIIAQHGYRSNRGAMLDFASLLADHGYGVLMMDARAHGDSGGELVTFGLKEVQDVRAGLDFLLSRPEIDPTGIGALGTSQGAVTLMLAAAQYPEIRAFVGDSPYASLQEEVAMGVQEIAGLPAFPWAPLIQFYAEREAGFSAEVVAPINRINEISPRPVLLLQGGQDNLVPSDTGERLLQMAGEPKQLWYEEQIGHVDFLEQMPQLYEQYVIGFFDQYLQEN